MIHYTTDTVCIPSYFFFSSGFGNICKGCTGYPAFLISGIHPEIRFHLPDIRLEKAIFNKKKQKANKITSKHLPGPFQYVANRSEIAIRNVSRFS